MTNGTLEFYPRSVLLKLSNREIFGVSDNFKLHRFTVDDDSSSDDSLSPDKSSYYRSKRAIERIVKLNHWSYFVTLTFSDQSSTPEDLLNKALNRLKYLIKKGVLYRFVLVPELTKKGVLHFHGFIDCSSESMIKSDCVKVMGFESPIKFSSYLKFKKYWGRTYIPVFNWYDWHFGWTVCYEVNENMDNLIRYMLKYVLKSENKKLFESREKSRRYFFGGDIYREVTKYNFLYPLTLNFDSVPDVEGFAFVHSTIPNTSTNLYYLEIPIDQIDKLKNIFSNNFDIQEYLKEFYNL